MEETAGRNAGHDVAREEGDDEKMSDRKSLTRRQKEVLSFIEEYLDEHGISPTLKEIAASLEEARSGLRTASEELAKLAAERILGRAIS